MVPFTYKDARMRYFLFTLSIMCFGLSTPVHAQDINAGFVQGLWYSEETVFEDVPTRIYVALRNNTDHDLTGTVRFSVDGSRIGSSDVRALSGRLVEAWVDWTPEYGEHTVFAQVSNAELHIIGQGTQEIDIASMTAEETLFVDYDTDEDGIGNEKDTDDDGDGISDADEERNGTDPLVPDETPEETEGESAVDAEEKGEETETKENEVLENSGTGLERFLSDGTTNDVFTAVTKKIESTKESLDDYRENKSEEKQKKRERSSAAAQPQDSESGDSSEITREKIEPKVGLFERFITLGGNLISSIWSIILLTISFLLGFPALIEIILLWLILIAVYRTARRYGRRPRP